MSGWVSVASAADLSPMRGHVVQVKGRLIAVFLKGEELFAIDDACPHMGASLAAGHVEDGVVMCPWHAWRFRITDGLWMDAPKTGTHVKCFEVKLENNQVWINVNW